MAKKLLIAFLVINTLIIVIGIILFVLGCMIISNAEEFHYAVRGVYKVSPVLLIIVGITISTMAVIGVFAAIDRKNKYLCGYIIALVFAMVLEMVAMAFSFYAASHMRRMLLDEKIRLKDPSLYLDSLQQKKECCGYMSYQDYTSGPENQPTEIPSSCCPDRPKTCIGISKVPKKNMTNYYKHGCREYILEYHEHMSVISGVTAIICIILSVALIIIIDKMGRIPVTMKPKKDLSKEKEDKVVKQEKKLEKQDKEEASLKL